MTKLPAALQEFLEPPALYTPGEPSFWQDHHISKGMLAAHLSTATDAASARPETIEDSADWIIKTTGLRPCQSLLDLGCGPGLYAQIWAEHGIQVSGMDLSARSLDYATQRARQAGLSIVYTQGNYITDALPARNDVITQIYCDFGVLHPSEQVILLEKIRASLKPNGSFVFDVLSPRHLKTLNTQPQLSQHASGFWSGDPHTELSQPFLFEGKSTFLNQNAILFEDGSVKIYRRWEHVFTQNDIRQLAEKTGLKVLSFHDNLVGTSDNQSTTLGIILARQ